MSDLEKRWGSTIKVATGQTLSEVLYNHFTSPIAYYMAKVLAGTDYSFQEDEGDAPACWIRLKPKKSWEFTEGWYLYLGVTVNTYGKGEFVVTLQDGIGNTPGDDDLASFTLPLTQYAESMSFRALAQKSLVVIQKAAFEGASNQRAYS
jgi:hypothetical protein